MTTVLGRGIVYFLLVVAAIALPMAALLVGAMFSPAPYVLASSEIAPEWLDGRDVSEHARVRVERLADAAAAREWAKARLDRIGADTRSSDFTGFARYRDGAKAGMLVPVANYVVEISADSRAEAERALSSLDFIRENPDKGLAWLLQNHIGTVIVAILAWLVLVGLLFPRMASWATTAPPSPSVAPVSEDELRRRILAINDANVPFEIVQDRHRRLRAVWRLADARWTHLVQAHRLLRVERLALELDARAHTVRMVEVSYRHSRSTGLLGLFARWVFWFGIRFVAVEIGKAMGLAWLPGRGWHVQEGYDYRFRARELKTPLATVVTGSGWTWKPVVTHFRPIGG